MPHGESRGPRRNLVGDTAAALRELVFAARPGELVGSLQDLSRSLGVGIVTLQQVARVLEHEGLLDARRGPRGGYYAARPDAAALERALAAFLRTHPASFREALNITSLLFTELAAAAATCRDETLREQLASVRVRLEQDGDFDFAEFEHDFQHLLFRMVEWPLFELLTEVTLRFAASGGLADSPPSTSTQEWKEGRSRIIAAILAGDPELARFEAERSNRRSVLRRI